MPEVLVGSRRQIDYEKLASIIPLTVRFLDNVLDRTRFPFPSIQTTRSKPARSD